MDKCWVYPHLVTDGLLGSANGSTYWTKIVVKPTVLLTDLVIYLRTNNRHNNVHNKKIARKKTRTITIQTGKFW